MRSLVSRGDLGKIELIEQHRRVDRIIEGIRIDHRPIGVFKVAHQELVTDPGQGIIEVAEQIVSLRALGG